MSINWNTAPIWANWIAKDALFFVCQQWQTKTTYTVNPPPVAWGALRFKGK